MQEILKISSIEISIIRKNIKNIYLNVLPPTGNVRISAPVNVDIKNIHAFATTKINWIRKKQIQIQSQKRDTEKKYCNKESHYVFGKRYLLKLIDNKSAPFIELNGKEMILFIKPKSSYQRKHQVISKWYRDQLRSEIPKLILKWENKIGVKIKKFYIQKMKTRWGSCNILAKTIRINSELAKKPKELLEYVIVHEIVHLLEKNHNDKFKSYMTSYLPKWKFLKDKLNQSVI